MAWTECAEENGTCSFIGTHSVKYGVTSAYVTRAFTSTAACNNATFGDPAVGQWKRCWVDSSPAAVTPAPTTATAPLVLATAPVVVATALATLAATTTEAATTVTPTAGAASANVTTAMWAEIKAQRAAFGDPNDCEARVASVPTTGTTLAAGGDIAKALASNPVIVLQTGTYQPTGMLMAIPTGKKLVAGAGQKPVIDLSAMTNFAAIYLGDNTVLSGVEIKNARGISIITFDTGLGHYSNGGLIHNTVVHDSGLVPSTSMDDGTGVAISGGGSTSQGQNWCLVGVESYNAYNYLGAAPTGSGGNSDGVSSKFGAGQNTFIGVNSHNNGDDGIDMWQGGATYHYFGTSHDNGKVPNVTNAGDGNGIKLGTGSIAHKFYKTNASGNATGGFNLNGNTMQPVLVQSTASGNPGGNYMNGVVAP